MKRNIFLILVLLITYSVSAQRGPNKATPESIVGGGVISGTVVDKSSGNPMEYTSVALYNSADSSLITGTISDNTGSFVLKDIPNGRYYLELNFIGYNNFSTKQINITPDDRRINLGQVSLSLNTKLIDEVEIVADQKRVEYKIDKKVVNVSQDLASAAGTAVDVLENTPSVSVDIEGNVSLRGSGNFTVLINGKPTVLDPADALRQIPASTIQNIEIITNPSVKYDPDGNGGIINVILKKQVERGTTGIINASIGLNNKYQADVLLNRRTGKLNYFIGGGYNDNRYDGSLIRKYITTQNDGSLLYNDAEGDFDFLRGGGQLKAGADYNLSSKSNVALEMNGGSYQFGIDRSNRAHEYTDPLIDENYYLNTDIMSRDRMYYSGNLNFTQTFDTIAHKLVAMANFSRSSGEGLEESEYRVADAKYIPLSGTEQNSSRNVETGLDNEFRFQLDYTLPLKTGNFEAGYQLRIEDDLNDFIYKLYDPDTDTYQSISENSSKITFFRNIQGAYVQVGGQIRSIQIQAGIRGEYTKRLIEYENFNSNYEIDRFDYYPTLHLSRQLNNDQQIMASYSKRVNRPRSYYLDSIPSYIDKQTIRVGNPGLEPEYINSFELGYQKGWGKNFLAFESYYRNTNNLITRITNYKADEGIYYMQFKNVNEDHTLGSEVMANWEFASWLNVNASTSVYYYRIKGDILGESFDNSNVSWRANTNTTFTISPMTRFQATIGYSGPSVTAQGRSEGMFYTNLAVRQDFLKRKLSATLQVRDLFGTMRREFTASGEGFSQSVYMQREPRVVMLSLSYRINNYRLPENRKMQDSGGGVDMDSGF